MGVTLVDSNVLLDIFTKDKKWYSWSSSALLEADVQGAIAINPIIYSEVSIRFEGLEELEVALAFLPFERLDLPWEAGFLAGKCFRHYRRRGGARRSPLPDFYIGAHASVSGFALLTRDPSRYRNYFPGLEILAPASLLG